MRQIIFKCLLLCLLTSSLAPAAALMSIDYILFTDANTVETTTSTKSAKSMYAFNLQFSLNAKKNLYFGWSLYNVTTKDETNQQKSNYATQDMGPSIRYEMGRSGLYFINFIYGIKTKTSFDSGSTAEEWLGTNYLLQLGVNPEISENFNASFAFNYFSGAAKTRVVSNAQTDVSYSKAFMTPTIGLIYKW
ncbi:MAG: hypothetical protein JNL11_09865 [Bdellovibrionaceae bacterium]|nr:hypothetical protein [Pseudobdellovibrionaceae bacterium]